MSYLIRRTKNNFWKDVFEAYQNLMRKNRSVNIHNILTTPIWFNNDITVSGAHVFYKSWYKKGIKVIGDIFDNVNFKTNADITEMYSFNFVDLLKYQGLCKSIKRLHLLQVRYKM